MKKIFNLEEEHLKIIKDIMHDHPELKSESAALRYIISSYPTQKKLCDQIAIRTSQDIKKEIRMLRNSVKASDQNTEIILDILNTLLFHFGIQHSVLRDTLKSDVLNQAEDNLKVRIRKNKQKIDNS